MSVAAHKEELDKIVKEELNSINIAPAAAQDLLDKAKYFGIGPLEEGGLVLNVALPGDTEVRARLWGRTSPTYCASGVSR